ncbi:MAG: amino acid-binding protein [Anaerolineae bacterium]
MSIQQVSVFLENKPGRLARVGEVLCDGRINIRALTVADTSDFGVLRLVVNRPQEAAEALKAAGFTVRLSAVVAVEIDDREGLFAAAMELCDAEGLNVEYVYSFVERAANKAILFLRFEETERAELAFVRHGFRLLSDEEIRGL